MVKDGRLPADLLAHQSDRDARAPAFDLANDGVAIGLYAEAAHDLKESSARAAYAILRSRPRNLRLPSGG